MRREGWIYVAGWLVILALFFVAWLVNGSPIGGAVRGATANVLPDAILGLFVLRLPSMIRWQETTRARFFAAHFGFLIAFIILGCGGWLALVALDSRLFMGHVTLGMSFRIIPYRILIDMLVYCTLAGIAYARQNAEEVREQAELASKAEALRARASLEAMRSQLNPHFILNTFHALVGLVRRDPAVAESALERLGDLLRYSLRIHRDGIDEVPLREECAFVESYLALERLRLADRLQVNIDTPPATLEYLVPTFAVQILVENAIRHAIAPRAAGGKLEIKVHEADGRLRVAVKDEGNGQAINARFEGSRMGLRLLQERLAALYGGNAKLTLRSVEGGTSADLDLPVRRASEVEQ